MDAIKLKFDNFKKDLDKNAYLEKLEHTVSVPKEYIVVGFLLLMAVLLFFRIGAGFICNVAGFVYPTYCSFKAIESADSADDTNWLIYWVFYAAFTIVENFIDIVLQWIPFYYFFKLGFLVWSFHPSTQGANWLYEKVIKELLNKCFGSVEGAGKEEKKTKKDD
uniref:Receptor expression-enhancing protein n=1 Tax=Heterosigma akashiwo TaxID=2829 RepID=A0A6S9EHY6_HETAK|mmetsp:Transcript_22066/g.36707  ORF Transcript_22066/g.36707 Transcript_22066/m.36707 type:complete len:164 (-) Transcript_22066:152-643(-)